LAVMECEICWKTVRVSGSSMVMVVPPTRQTN